MDGHDRDLVLAFGGGLLVAVAAPILAPIVDEVIRPVAKAVLRQSMLGLERLHTSSARLGEALEDLLAEVRAEVEEELAARANASDEAGTASGPNERIPRVS